MDGQLADPSDEELKKLRDQFVCVRRIRMGGVDLATFQFDPFLSWSIFFMNADKTIYGRYGRAHPQTKRNQKDSNPNHMPEGLKAAMSAALKIHRDYARDPATWGKALAGKTGPKPRWRFAEKTPAARKYGRLKSNDSSEKGCVHCHEVQRVMIDSYIMKRIPLPDSMLWLYPRPEVVGLTMDNRHSARVTRVAADSPVARAGLRAGDDIASMNGQPLVSIADFQWVLHNSPDEGGVIPIEVSRAGKPVMLSLRLEDGWRRKEDFGWRYRVAGYASWMWAGVSFRDGPEGVVVAQRSPRWFKKANEEPKRKLQPADVIVEVDGKAGMDRSALLAYLIREKKLGSTVKLVVLRGGTRIKIDFRIPKKQPEILGH